MEAGDKFLPLFETKQAKGRLFYRLFASTVFVGICFVLAYRVSYIPRESENGRWIWIGLLGAELWFGFYWIVTQAVRWNIIYRHTFKDRLSQRYGDDDLPKVDVFVCTADPEIEPPIMVVNTVLSAVAYEYPPEKLSVYLSDDAGSKLTYYAMLEASSFAKHWVPYCKKFNVEPRSPAAYFISMPTSATNPTQESVTNIEKLYEEMKDRIETAAKLGRVPEEAELKHHQGFSQWDSYSSKLNHNTILQILLDGKDKEARDRDGCALPTLVYLAREKRPQHFHNFKAGAINALIRVSSKISNGEIILTLDCDMYSNNSGSVRDALCFFLDDKSHDIAFVQFPQNFLNITLNDLYGNSLRVIYNVELHGIDGYGGPLYIGTGCFLRRDVLCGRRFTKDCRTEWHKNDVNSNLDTYKLEQEIKPLANSTFDQNTQWGYEMGMKYGCPVEDVLTGLEIHYKGWRSVYLNPERKAFMGVAPTSLSQVLVQHKRWSEGDLQIIISKYSPAWFAYGRINLGLRMGYCCYCLWAFNSLPTLYFSIIPSLCLLRGIPLFPQVSSLWFWPFAYVVFAKYIYSLAEFLWAGGTVLGWWNEQRIWLFKRTSSYIFAFIDAILKSLGFAETRFVITAKVADEDVSRRYEKEIMEFGTSSSSPMLTILTTLAMLNLFCFVGVVMKILVLSDGLVGLYYETMALQITLCCVLVLLNWPLYQSLLLRKDKGKMPSSLLVTSFMLAFLSCTSFTFLY